tara:strand:- start:32 stop:703 length:672 start_codon:yes stop_codon:yes gene_type:complete
MNGFKLFQPSTPIAREGLAVLLDASDPNSYPASGTYWWDTSGNGRNATIRGSVPFVNDGLASYFDFPGNLADYMDQTGGSAVVFKDMCIVFKVDAMVSSFASLISRTTSTGQGLRIVNNNISNPGNGDDWAGSVAQGGPTTYFVNGVADTDTVPITNGQWYILGGSTQNSTFLNSVWSYYLGRNYSTNRNLDGKIAFVALYNRVLSADEQLQNYNALKGRFGV